MAEIVMCIGREPACLSDGRRVRPGATADNVDVEHPENRALIDDEQLLVIDAPEPDAEPEKPRRRPSTKTKPESEEDR